MIEEIKALSSARKVTLFLNKFPLRLTATIFLWTTQAQASLNCAGIFSSKPSRISNLIQIPEVTDLISRNKVQEAIWFLENLGATSEAHVMKSEVLTEILRLNQMEYTPWHWQGNKINNGNQNDAYLFQMDGFSVVVEFGSRPAMMNPMAYKIANLLHVRVPFTTRVVIGGHVAAARVVTGPGKNSKQWKEEGFSDSVNESIQAFDRLLNNWERTPVSVLTPGERIPEAPQKQIATDNRNILSVMNVEGWLTTKSSAFIAEVIPALKIHFPDTHRAFNSRMVEKNIATIVKNQKLENSDLLIQHMQNFFKDYRRISDHYDGLTSAEPVLRVED